MLFERPFGLHVIQFPSGRFGYVGSVPAALCRRITADRAAVMGGRAVREGDETVEYRPISFETEAAAVAFAAAVGYDAKTTVKV